MPKKKDPTAAPKKRGRPKKKAPVAAMPENLGAIDVAFVIDVTGSMGPYIEEAKRMVAQITKKIQDENGLDIRVALAVYRDHPPQEFSFVAKGHDFVSIDAITAILAQYHAGGGGDHPEAVYDGLNEVFKFSWREGADRAVYLIGDAPPHENCPCKLTAAGLIDALKKAKLQVNAHSIANDKITTDAFRAFVEATEGTLTVGQRPEYTTKLYTDSLGSKSSDITMARAFINNVTSTLGMYTSTAALSLDTAVKVAVDNGMTEEEALKTISYLNKRGL